MIGAARGLGRLDLSTFGSPAGTAVGAGLVCIAWLVIGIGSSFARARGLARPLALLAYTQAIHLVHVAMRVIVPALAAQRVVFAIGEGASLWTLPASLQIALRLAGREGPRSRQIVRALYLLTGVAQIFAGTRAYNLAIVPVFVVVLSSATIVLARATFRQVDVERRRRGLSLLVGLPLYGLLQLADAASQAGFQIHPPTLLSLFPIGMIGYGAIGADMLVTTSGIQRALRIGRTVGLRLLAIVVTLGIVFAGRSFHSGLSLRLIAPPAITTALCLALAWQALSIEEATASTVAWGVLAALVGFLKLDITLLALVEDARTALWISRVDHFFFVFTPVVVVHVVRSVTRWTSQRWIVWCFWIAALIVAPLTFSDAYFPTTVHHWFGWFARAGWIYLAYQVVLSAALTYGLGILVSATIRARKSARLGYALILLGYVSAAALMLLGDQRSVLGEDVYPYGNFAFVSFALIAWGILRGELADFRGVVRTTVAHGILSTFLTGLLAALIVFVVRFTDEGGPLVAAVSAALVTMVGLAPIRGWAQRGVDGLLGTDRFDEAEAFRDFTDATSGSMRTHDVADAARRVVEHTFQPTAAAVLLRTEEGGFARGPFTLDAEDPALLELRRTLEIVRCGSARMPTPPGLVGWRGNVVLVPLAHRGRMLGVLAIASSPRAPLVSRRAVGFLRSFADHVALVLENASLHGDLEGAVERRTAELAELVAKLESAARKAQDAGDARAELVQSVRLRAEEMRRTNPDAQSRAAIDAALDLVESTITPGDDDPALAETAAALRASRRNESGSRRAR
jgi:GAF domain-containing protein